MGVSGRIPRGLAATPQRPDRILQPQREKDVVMPKVLGRYHIISELGRGGMGVVYKAVDPKLERFIAIKCLNEELSSDEITVTRFLREARNVGVLNHPNIAQIFLADEDDGKPYFVMEFVDGESLADRLARDGRLLPEQARRIVTECAQALKAAHEENIVHRDIKPGNIMIDRRGRSVLTDFGIASVVHPDAEQVKSSYIMGTPGYLPPEVMTGLPADHRGDLFALGAVYYEMLAGKRLVPGSGLEDTARTLLAADFPELSDLDETLDEKTFGVLGRMLAPDPDKRYQSYDALLADLGFASAADAASAAPVDVATAVAPSPVGDSSPAHAPTAKVPTQTIDPTRVEAPTTQSAAPPRSGSKAALLVFALLVLVGLGASGFAVVKFAPAQIERVTSLLGMDTDDPTRAGEISVAANQIDADADASPTEPPASSPAEQPRAPLESSARSASELEMPSSPLTSEVVMGADLASAPEPRPTTTRTAGDASLAAAPVDPEPAMGEAEDAATAGAAPELTAIDEAARPMTSATEARVDSVVEQARAGDEGIASAARPVEPFDRVARPSVENAPRAPSTPPPPPPPEGILVIGLGDAAITDPMLREIERALREDGHELIERGFVSGLSALTQGDELDLNALSDVALDAGARHVVVARALPAGQRRLNFYGRSDTAFMVQADTITYDLVERRRTGSTAVEQIEYTGLNATQKAQDLIAQRLGAIRADLDR
jgi:serine/threonine-protein kinase